MSELLVNAGLFTGLPVVLLLFFFRRKNKSNNVLLALSIFSIWYSLLVNNLNATGQILNYPYLFRTANITAYLILPFLYLYTRNTFYPGIYWRKRDWLFFLPVLIYCIDLLPVFFSSNAYKISIIKEAYNDPYRFFSIPEGWIGIKGFHFFFRYLFAVLMMALQIRLIIRNWNFEPKESTSHNRPLFWFIFTLTLIYIPMIIPGIFGVIFHLKWYSLYFINVNLAISLLAITGFILFSPKILYGFYPLPTIIKAEPAETVPQPVEETVPESQPKATDIPRLYLNEEDVSALIKKVELFMEEKKPYLNHRFTIHDLGRDIEIPVYQLSPVINQHFGSNFSSWINKYRISYFIELCNGENKKELTFDALSNESGFSNRVTFIKAFKKEKGTTPGIFMKEKFKGQK